MHQHWGEIRNRVGEVNASPNQKGKLHRSLTEKQGRLYFLYSSEDLHVGGDTGKSYVTAAPPVPCANALTGAPFPYSFCCAVGYTLPTMAVYRSSPCDANHACTSPGRSGWLDTFDPPDFSASYSRSPHAPNPRVSRFMSDAIETATLPRAQPNHSQVGRPYNPGLVCASPPRLLRLGMQNCWTIRSR